MPKYPTKIWLLPAGLAVFIIVGSVIVNGFLYVTKNRVEQETWRNLGHPLSIEDIFYLFPNQIVLKNVVLAENFPSAGRQADHLFKTPKLIIKFSLGEALVRRHFSIRAVTLAQPDIKYRPLADFLHTYTKEILRILDQLTLNDIQVRAKNIAMSLEFSDKVTDTAVMDFTLAIKGKDVNVTGSVSPKNEAEQSLRFQLRGKAELKGLFLKEVVVERYDFYAKSWGDINFGRLQLNGFALLDTLAKPDNLKKISKNQRLKAIINRLKRNPHADDNRRLDPNVYILDIGCRAKLAFPQTEIEAFVFTVNNVPVSLKGTVALDKPISLDVTGSIFASLYPAQTFKRADLSLSAVFRDKTIDTNGNIKINFMDSGEAVPFQEININFKNNVLSVVPGPRLKFQLAQGEMAYLINQNPHLIQLQDITAYLNFLNPLKLVSFHSSFYDGQFDGKVWIDNSQFPVKVNGTFILKNTEANQLDMLLDHFAKIHGKVFSQIYFTNDPAVALKGKIAIQDGHFKEFEFFKWLADNFVLESLRNVAFQKASADFTVDMQKAGLYNINLVSDDIKVGGSFAVDRDKLVSSKLSLMFSRDLLETSFKFRPILARQNEENFGFDFQLSGRQQAMNFQWLDSVLKQNIQSWIPNFIERRIERNIDESLQQPVPAAQDEHPTPQ